MTRHSTTVARQIKEAYDEVSPLIESYTAATCPTCTSVCCIDRHGTHEHEDLIYFDALKAMPLGMKPLPRDTEPCRYLSETGCRLKRWQRPFKCTWYFCDRLLKEVSSTAPRRHRALIEALQRLQNLRSN